MTDSHRGSDEQTSWDALVAEAAKLAADDIRDRDDPDNRQLRADLEEIHARLTANADDARD